MEKTEGYEKLILGYAPEDARRVEIHLKTLLKYLDPKDFIVVGGLAIRHHLLFKGINYPPRYFNDLDILVSDIDLVPHEITRDFLVQHYHLYDGVHYKVQKDRFYLVLVEPVSKSKLDIFDIILGPPHRTQRVNFEQYELNLVSIEDQLVKAVRDVSNLLQGRKIDSKHLTDANLLLKIADLPLAEKYWQEQKDITSTLSETLEEANKKSDTDPHLLYEKVHRKKDAYKCEACIFGGKYPITDMKEIYETMGFIE